MTGNGANWAGPEGLAACSGHDITCRAPIDAIDEFKANSCSSRGLDCLVERRRGSESSCFAVELRGAGQSGHRDHSVLRSSLSSNPDLGFPLTSACFSRPKEPGGQRRSSNLSLAGVAVSLCLAPASPACDIRQIRIPVLLLCALRSVPFCCHLLFYNPYYIPSDAHLPALPVPCPHCLLFRSPANARPAPITNQHIRTGPACRPGRISRSPSTRRPHSIRIWDCRPGLVLQVMVETQR
ncbi:hypothetical protein B0T25DRAFT_161373 [Lasiosphaeria hispida]|uniref:Uncharacterized protein n=1 Tax=Lasiosphaeria hispida TaxID=260671 RepID=A0AAJ0HMW5_9PEZI|nr:hypothetical protein B0T25DRAFT_161373 [Lasiosphaeria hispida]